MKFLKCVAVAIGLTLGLAFPGCSTEGDTDETVSQLPQDPADNVNLNDALELTAADVDRMNAVSQDLEGLALLLDAFQTKGELDAELAGIWSSARNAGFRSVMIMSTKAAVEGLVLVKSSAVSDFERNLETFDPVLSALVDQSGSLPRDLQAAFDAFSNKSLTHSAPFLSQQPELMRLREDHCCTVYTASPSEDIWWRRTIYRRLYVVAWAICKAKEFQCGLGGLKCRAEVERGKRCEGD